MTDSPPPAAPVPRPRRRRVRRALALAALLAVVFVIWILRRGGETVERPLVALLPADTALALQIHQLAQLLDAYDASPLARLINTDPEIGALLLSQDELVEWRQRHAEAEIETHLDLGRDFLLRWAGREVTLAFVRAESEPHPGLVVISQAQLRFHERVAELVAQLYPGARLQTSEHRGTPITTWVGRRSRDSLSFCRFGETVALSIRTDSTAYLEAIIDAVRAETPPEQPVFPPPTSPGLHAWASAQRLPAFLASLPSDSTQAWLASPDGERAMERLRGFEELRFTYALDAPREVRLDLRARPGTLPATQTAHAWREEVPATAIAAAHFEEPFAWWRDNSRLLFDFSFHPDPDWTPERLERRRAKREWRARLGRWLEGQVLPLLDGPVTVFVDSVVPRLGLPLIRAAGTWQTSQPEALRAELERLRRVEEEFLAGIDEDNRPEWLSAPWRERTIAGERLQTWNTPVGQAGWTIRDGRLLATLDDAEGSLTARVVRGETGSLAGQDDYRRVVRLWGEDPRGAEVYVHTLRLTELSGLLLLSAAAWGDGAQEIIEQFSLANHLMRVYPAMGLALQQTRDRLSVVLAIAASGEPVTPPIPPAAVEEPSRLLSDEGE